MSDLLRFIRKYEFPVHLLVGTAAVRARFSTWIGTARAKFLLRILGCRAGKNFQVDGRLWIWALRKGAICIGDNVTVNSRFGSNLIGLTNPSVFQCWDNGTITIGNYCGLSGVVLSARAGITIGDRVMVGGNVRIFDHNFHSLDFKKRRNNAEDQADCKKSPVVIGNDVFIGTNAMILKGVTVGDRAIIGAGSVVTCDVPADEVWAGNPAVRLKAASGGPTSEDRGKRTEDRGQRTEDR